MNELINEYATCTYIRCQRADVYLANVLPVFRRLFIVVLDVLKPCLLSGKYQQSSAAT